jgi:CheY-like chemotaxis protein
MNQSPELTASFLSTISNTYLILFVLFLVLIMLGIYIYFSSKLSKQSKLFNDTVSKAKEMETNQNALLSSISDNIYNLTKNLVDEESVTQTVEGEILTSANNLRELLKIQANKIEIYQEKFTLSHMLDDVTMYLASNFTERNTELVFDIDPTMPRYMTGDVIHFSRIINNILEYAIQATPQGKVNLKISCEKPINNEIILNIEIKDGARGFTEEQLQKLFELVYDTKTNEQKGLQLYIAKKLTLAMGGTIDASRGVASGNMFSLQLPMKLNDESHLEEFSDLKKGLNEKKVLIFASKPATGFSLEKLFKYFYKEVRIVKREELDKRKVNFMDFDIIVLDDIFFNTTNNEHLKLVKGNKNIYIVAFSSIFGKQEHEENTLVDMYIHTPSNLERIVELIEQFDAIEVEEVLEESIVIPTVASGELLVYKDIMPEAQNIDIDCFTYFKGARLLIVEDNLINQKIIVSVLKKSGMEIEIANNGQEALDFLLVEKKQFDIVLMDISMPIMDGLLATQRIREYSHFNQMPIVTFTAFAMGAEIEEMFDAGCNAYLTKPLNIKKLYNMFNMFLTQSDREVSLHKSIEIEGLDIEKGIALADESEILYKETLKEFVLVYKDMAETIPRWLKEKRYDRVKLACSEIQGILGAIGAYDMKALVDEMQKNFLYNNEEFLDKYILLYPEKYNNLMDTIQKYLRH